MYGCYLDNIAFGRPKKINPTPTECKYKSVLVHYLLLSIKIKRIADFIEFMKLILKRKTVLIIITSLIIFFDFKFPKWNIAHVHISQIIHSELKWIWYTIYSQFNTFLVFDCSLFIPFNRRYQCIHNIRFVSLS